MSVNLLAIESSCDDTSASVLTNGAIRSNVIASQKVHSQYGGVVPELASRVHLTKIITVTEKALIGAGILKESLNAIAFTSGPGLIGSLMVGSSFAKSLSLALRVPLIGVHHMQAHVLSNFIDEPKPSFPFLCLTVSGGHTQIILVKDYSKMEVVGETKDDAAGEAFDKTASLIKLPYPGGPMIDKLAKSGNPKAFEFPEPNVPGLNFSFSGLKTSILFFIKENIKKNPRFIEERINDICASVQHRIVSILLRKLQKAADQFNIKEIAIAGGVSSNSGLREAAVEMSKRNGWHLYIPAAEYCTDNAAMIAITAYYKFLAGDFEPLSAAPSARMEWKRG
ncbi:MAG: tRNA (adenosine(37)-N6)-threonylcarbamoyltransferase complex transferase subunit TsaD [Chitinophagales bacterium]|jgi:N6-L-threonylcarbamoyladenine synthase|nr:tRNA (adenosine(37)-N6)-threonylcarbamoyltransferase complex transferase subunit TsaD [Chitinophagales bacterium]